MRLPTIHAGHERMEDSREMHERLYTAFLAGQPVDWPVPPTTTAGEELHRLQGNLHKFWASRGFRVKSKVVHRLLIRFWLESIAEHPTKPRLLKGDGVQRVKTVGPVVKTACVGCGWRSDRRRHWLTFDLGDCRECGGAMQPIKSVRDTRADEKAKRELREQGAA